jgi:hypothetical protein
MLITKNITIEELCISETAIRKNISNIPNQIQIAFLKDLAVNVLQPIRDFFNKPVIIGPQHSGYRCDELNKAVGGEPNSQHPRGQAADFVVDGIKLSDVYLHIVLNMDYDQVIFEDGRWIHCSYNSGHNRKSKLVSFVRDGKRTYEIFTNPKQLGA